MALMTLGAFVCFGGFGLSFLHNTLFLLLLLSISVIDFHHRIIPDELSLSGIALGFLLSFVPEGVTWWESGLGIVAGGGCFFPSPGPTNALPIVKGWVAET